MVSGGLYNERANRERRGEVTKRDALSVSLKIIGLVALYRTVFVGIMMVSSTLLRLEMMAKSQSFYAYLTWQIIWVVLSLAAGCILLKWGDRIAARLVRQDAELPAIPASGWQKPVFVVALKVVGVVCLVNGVAGFARAAASAAHASSVLRLFTGYPRGEGYYSIVLIALAVYLLSGAKHLVAFAFKERKGPGTATE
jgi:hypothetical protein